MALEEQQIRQIIKEELRNFFRDKLNISMIMENVASVSVCADDVRIDNLQITVRLFNGLKRAGIKTLGEAKALKKDEFLKFSGVNIKSWEELEGVIDRIKMLMFI